MTEQTGLIMMLAVFGGTVGVFLVLYYGRDIDRRFFNKLDLICAYCEKRNESKDIVFKPAVNLFKCEKCEKWNFVSKGEVKKVEEVTLYDIGTPFHTHKHPDEKGYLIDQIEVAREVILEETRNLNKKDNWVEGKGWS